MSVTGTPPHSRAGSPLPGAQPQVQAPVSPINGSQGSGYVQPPLPVQPPSPAAILNPIKNDFDILQEIIDGLSDISLSDFQSLMGQVAGWASVASQFERVEKDTVNSIFHYMAREEGSLALPYSCLLYTSPSPRD